MIVVYAYVICDIIHKGHLVHLQNAKALGDVLIVGVLTDEAVMERKSKPTISFNERFDIVRNLKMVDVAIPQETYLPDLNILDIRPDIVAESTSHKSAIVQATKEAAKTVGARVMTMPYWTQESSTKIKKRIKDGI